MLTCKTLLLTVLLFTYELRSYSIGNLLQVFIHISDMNPFHQSAGVYSFKYYEIDSKQANILMKIPTGL